MPSATVPVSSVALPRLALGQWPTPVTQLEHLGKHVDRGLWVKRDDLSSPLYGGNKVRKLELLLADAQRRESRSLIAVGGIGSNQVLATTIFGRSVGLTTKAIVFPQPMTQHAMRNAAFARANGALLIPTHSRLTVPMRVAAELRRDRSAYLLAPGGSSPLGVLGYVEAAFELREQIRAGELPEPDEIVVALGSGGTAAGLAIGLALVGLRTHLVVVRVVERVLCNPVLLQTLIARTCSRLHGKSPRSAWRTYRGAVDRIIWEHGHIGRCYGSVTPEGTRATQLASDLEGLHLEPVYTAKAMAALIDRCKGITLNKHILFWHTADSALSGAEESTHY